MSKDLEGYLNKVDYRYLLDDYVPSKFALEFVTFIKLVNGSEGEEHSSPIIHYDMIDQVVSTRQNLFVSFRGSAKALALDTPVMTPTGNVPIGDLIIGDTVFDRNGKKTLVTRVSEVFSNDTYKFELSDGSSFVANEDHYHIVHVRTIKKVDGKNVNYFKEEELTTLQLLERGIHYNRTVTSKCPLGKEVKWFIPLVSNEVDYDYSPTSIDPYTVGYILGDGNVSIGSGMVTLVAEEEDFTESLTYIPYPHGTVYRDKRNTNTLSTRLHGLSKLVLTHLGDNTCLSKFIPNEYLYNSIEVRLGVLRGLMDTDGTVTGKSRCSFTSASESLANGVLHLVKSLGANATIKGYENSYSGYYTVAFSLQTHNPFKLKRKADRWVSGTKYKAGPRVSILSVKKTPKPVPSRCISVASPTRSFLMENSVVTRNTTALHEYMILYLATYGRIPGFGEVHVGMYISDTMDNGVKSMRTNLEYRWNNSDFLKLYVPKTKFTDVRWEFENVEGKKLCFRGFGASTGVRGFKEYGQRPTWCHKVGTVITTDAGTHKVEDYYNKLEHRLEVGRVVSVCGIPYTETVTDEHKYLVKSITRKRAKKYLSDGSTKSTTSYCEGKAAWKDASKLTQRQGVGQQQVLSDYLGEAIDKTALDSIPMVEGRRTCIQERDAKGRIVKTSRVPTPVYYKDMEDTDFWWMYGLWLADGHRSKRKVGFAVAYTEEHTVGRKLEGIISKLGHRWYRRERVGCYQIEFSDVVLSRWLKKCKRGCSTKDMPAWVLQLPYDKQLGILLGYIAGDGYKDLKNNQVRINSVNLTVLEQLGNIAGRLGLPYHIRKTKKAGVEVFPGGYSCNTQEQFEIRFRDNVKEVLGIPIENSPRQVKEVFIAEGKIWRKVKKVEVSEVEEFVPIVTPSREYSTSFGISHNCGYDDLMSDKNAESATITRDIKHIIYKAARQALHPSKRMQIWTGTPFNKSDPLYEATTHASWNVRTYPICEKFPCAKEDFRGAWEDRFSYDFVKNEYDSLLESGEVSAFNQELMLRITSDEDRLIQDHDVVWFERKLVLKNRSSYNFYITTDLATSNQEKADYSVIGVWAYSSNHDWMLVDGICARQLMDQNIDDLFRLVSMYKPLSVGIEINGQQGGFIQWIKQQMLTRKIFFSFAGRKGVEGIRRTRPKIEYLKTFLPVIKSKKFWLPEEMRESVLVEEIMEEFRYVTPDGFKSKCDDATDMITMLQEIECFAPTEEVSTEYVESEDGTFAFSTPGEDDSVYKNNLVF